MKILIVEDSAEVVETLKLAMEMAWPDADILTTILGNKGVEMVETENPDVVILDLQLPDIDGFEVLRQIRLFSDIPILVLTVRSGETDIVKALGLGADEYVTKPFKPFELAARIKALLRRSRDRNTNPISFGKLKFDPSTFKFTSGKEEINLTRTEGLILARLMKNGGDVVPHDELIESVWGENYPDAGNNLKVYIRYLREKLEKDPANPEMILTKPGIGYFLTRQ